MTKQELFDRVADHLLTQGERAEDDDGCVYRAPHRAHERQPLRCAVGCLIDEEHYDTSLEGMSIFSGGDVHSAVEASIGSKLTLDQVIFLEDLQKIHDVAPISEWRTELSAIADDHDLDPSVAVNHA